eukprot:TRINITY_DN6033_c0_g1_i1.p1 TRINITY_DN6033_c0_g1~~TRINITY_DN6033_c0_g1_i1.p1  ORF type:complete len:274 (-),score=79.77 TRINITY_DN6033_c0_g1_i1:20-841(-)
MILGYNYYEPTTYYEPSYACRYRPAYRPVYQPSYRRIPRYISRPVIHKVPRYRYRRTPIRYAHVPKTYYIDFNEPKMKHNQMVKKEESNCVNSPPKESFFRDEHVEKEVYKISRDYQDGDISVDLKNGVFSILAKDSRKEEKDGTIITSTRYISKKFPVSESFDLDQIQQLVKQSKDVYDGLSLLFQEDDEDTEDTTNEGDILRSKDVYDGLSLLFQEDDEDTEDTPNEGDILLIKDDDQLADLVVPDFEETVPRMQESHSEEDEICIEDVDM